jgi:hypothetical protein
MNGETDARQNADSAPLPPVRTRWTEPDAADESRAPLPPFYASRHHAADEAPVPAEAIDETMPASDEAEPWASYGAEPDGETPTAELVLDEDAALEDEIVLDDDAILEDVLVFEEPLELADDEVSIEEPAAAAEAASPAAGDGVSDWEAFGRLVEESADWFDASLGMVEEESSLESLSDETAEDDAASYEIEVVGLESIDVTDDAGDAGDESQVDGMVPQGEMLNPAVAFEPAREESAAAEVVSAVPQEEPAADTLARDLAERLARLAERLRREGTPALEYTMAEGDRLDASIAGFLAGYVAASGE